MCGIVSFGYVLDRRWPRRAGLPSIRQDERRRLSARVVARETGTWQNPQPAPVWLGGVGLSRIVGADAEENLSCPSGKGVAVRPPK